MFSQENWADQSDSEDLTEEKVEPFQRNFSDFCPELSVFNKNLSNLILKFETIMEYSDSINGNFEY